MKYLTIIAFAITVLLTGCATPPRWLAAHYNSQDMCQQRNNPDRQLPSFCGAGSAGRTTVYATPTGNPIGREVGYTKKN